MNIITNRLPDIALSTTPEDLICYGFDASGVEDSPSAVVWPATTDEVSKVMKYAFEKGMPVVPRGAGTGMTAGAVPSRGAIILSFEKMNRLIEVDSANLSVVCEPGLINGRLQKELNKKALFYPPDPASMNFCTIGGNVAENAGGPRALKYGVTRDYVMEIEAVLPDGTIMPVGVRTAKGVVGYDLVRLLTGSEGTLSIFTKIRLKVLPSPGETIALLAVFDSVEAAGETVSGIIASGILPVTLEFMDREAVAAVERYRPVGLPENAEALLLIELDGYPSSISKEAERIADFCLQKGADVKMAEDEDARESLWIARRAVSPALYRIKPNKINEDIVVPRDRVTEMLTRLRRLSDETGITIVNFGHAGDGNIHVNIMVDKENPEEYGKGLDLVEKIFHETLALGGTISGEHGIGLTKSKYLGMELSEAEMAIMKSIKKVFDPKNILNPGKIFPE
jgi:glycolate oxidase